MNTEAPAPTYTNTVAPWVRCTHMTGCGPVWRVSTGVRGVGQTFWLLCQTCMPEGSSLSPRKEQV